MGGLVMTASTEVRAEQARPTRPEPARRRRLSFEGRMMTPGIALLAPLSLLPFVFIVLMSFSEVHLLGGVRLAFAGLRNWARAFTDPDVGMAWVRSLLYFVLTVGIEMVLGVVFALCLWRLLRGRNAVLGMLLLPMFVAPVFVGLLGRFLTDSTFGLYAWVLRHVGVQTDVLASQSTAFAATVLMDVWEWTPLIALIVLAGLASVPGPVLDAAAVDGAGYWKRLRHIIMPMIAGVVIVALLVRSMDAIRYFDIIYNTTNGGPADATKIVPIRLYETAFRFFDLGYAAAIGLSMLAASILVANLFMRTLKRRGLAR
jgi:multiple sugar transport system permease protein